MKKALVTTVLAGVFAVGLWASIALAGGDDHGKPEFVTICHAAGQAGTTKFVTLTIPYNAAFGQAGHFGENGTPNAGHEQDYLGPCEGDETTPTETEPTTTTPTTTTPTTTTPTTPTPPRCPPGTEPTGGKDGDESEPHHNQECKPITPPTTTTTPPTTPTTTVTTATTTTPTATTPTTTTTTPQAPQPPKTSSTSSSKPPKDGAPPKTPKLTGNPKVDKCKETGTKGVLNCKGVIVTQAQG